MRSMPAISLHTGMHLIQARPPRCVAGARAMSLLPLELPRLLRVYARCLCLEAEMLMKRREHF